MTKKKKPLEGRKPEDYQEAAENSLELAKVLAGQGGISDQDFLERMARSDDLVDHDGETCGMCHNMILGAQVAREMLAAGEYEDMVSKWAEETRRRWENSKFFKLWQEELKAGRDPHQAFKDRGVGTMSAMNVKTTYLEMVAQPQRVVPQPREGLAVVHARRPTVAYYRFVYDAVGRDYDWTSRKKMSDAELAALLHDPRLEVHVLMADGVPAGFAELDRRIEGEIELVSFGLMPEFIGQGLGRYFLQWTIDRAWSYGPRRFWLHTCTKDHMAALPNYLKAGFAIFKEGLHEEDM